jgi:hypothetical protein
VPRRRHDDLGAAPHRLRASRSLRDGRVERVPCIGHRALTRRWILPSLARPCSWRVLIFTCLLEAV